MPLTQSDVIQVFEQYRNRFPIRSITDQYRLRPVLDLKTVEEFERRHNIALPEEYGNFLLTIGNGCEGPWARPYPLGLAYSVSGQFIEWRDGIDVGTLSEPFPHRDAWNVPQEFLDRMPEWPEPEESDDAFVKRRDDWFAELDRRNSEPGLLNGTIPIGGDSLLVVTGEQRGNIWGDSRHCGQGLYPRRGSSGEPTTFLEWFTTFLEETRSFRPYPPEFFSDLTALLTFIPGMLLGFAILRPFFDPTDPPPALVMLATVGGSWFGFQGIVFGMRRLLYRRRYPPGAAAARIVKSDDRVIPVWLLVGIQFVAMTAGIDLATMLGWRGPFALVPVAIVCSIASVIVLEVLNNRLMKRRKLRETADEADATK